MLLEIQSTWLSSAANTNCSCAVSGFFTLEGHWTICVIFPPRGLAQVVFFKENFIKSWPNTASILSKGSDLQQS